MKILKKIVSAFVWSKGLRHAIRAGRLRHYCRVGREYAAAKGRADFPHYLAVAAIVKNEGEYLPEWLEYHMLMGATKFYIYDNGSTDDTRRILAPYMRGGGSRVRPVAGPGHAAAGL